MVNLVPPIHIFKVDEGMSATNRILYLSRLDLRFFFVAHVGNSRVK